MSNRAIPAAVGLLTQDEMRAYDAAMDAVFRALPANGAHGIEANCRVFAALLGAIEGTALAATADAEQAGKLIGQIDRIKGAHAQEGQRHFRAVAMRRAAS